jgi:putative transposase
MRASYKVRTYPTPGQVAVLNRTFGCVRLVWNKVLAWRQDRYRTEGLRTSYAETDRYLTELKRDPGLGFLFEVSSVPLQQTLRHQHTAFVNFFARRARYPRYKSRQARQSATFTRSAFGWRERRLYLAKRMDAPLEVVWSWPAVDPASIEPTSVTVSREPCGRWYVSFAAHVADPETAPPTGAVVGVDLGVKNFAVTVIDRWYPSSKTCSSCGHRLAELSLVRAWCCPSCRTLHDRDVNAAKNILAAGRAVSACGGDVRHPGSSSRVRSPAKQEPQPARAGIPALKGGE